MLRTYDTHEFFRKFNSLAECNKKHNNTFYGITYTKIKRDFMYMDLKYYSTFPDSLDDFIKDLSSKDKEIFINNEYDIINGFKTLNN